jgi:RNA polymerase sigma-70 factor (ECF subfamily)
LLALMLLNEARRDARVGASGELVLLADQDRTRWDKEFIAEGHALVRECVRRNRPGPYQLQAAISAVHTSAANAQTTDWKSIVQLYDQLLSLTPNPIVALNRAVAVAEIHGPETALPLVENCDLDSYYLYHAIRADLLQRAGRRTEALDAYDRAIARSENSMEREFLIRRKAATTAKEAPSAREG